MARVLIVLGFATLLLGGCAQPGVVVDPLPNPNFNGPVLAAQPRPQHEGPIVKPQPPRETVKVAPPVAPPGAAPREWAPSVASRQWQWIVVHHSATATGSAGVFDRQHREKGWDELGYHFVIGNGTNSGDGQIEVGSRWTKQKWGAHTKTSDNRFNEHGIGICLVGNFDLGRPSAAQMRALARLTGHLMRTYRIPASHIIGHCDAKATDCPGRYVSLPEVRRLAAPYAASGQQPDRALAAKPGR